MRVAKFAQRMKALISQGWRVVSLDAAVHELVEGGTVDDTVAFTTDEGWESTLNEVAPALAECQLPGTPYVTTYYAEREANVFKVNDLYMLRKTKLYEVSLYTGRQGFDDIYRIRDDALTVGFRWVEFAKARFSRQQRQTLLVDRARALESDPAEMLTCGRGRIVRRDRIRTLSGAGIDIQVNSHRHSLPDSSYEARGQEVPQIQMPERHWIGKPRNHCCYLSGACTVQKSDWLARTWLSSSTTCNSGTNLVGIQPLALRRIVDRDNRSGLDCEAALSGLTELLAPFTRTELPRE